MNKQRIPLHVLEPDETLYERCYWLALFVKDLKKQLSAVLLENARLEDAILGNPLAEERGKELVALRQEHMTLLREHKKLMNEHNKLLLKRKELKQEVLSLRDIHDHFQLPSAQA